MASSSSRRDAFTSIVERRGSAWLVLSMLGFGACSVYDNSLLKSGDLDSGSSAGDGAEAGADSSSGGTSSEAGSDASGAGSAAGGASGAVDLPESGGADGGRSSGGSSGKASGGNGGIGAAGSGGRSSSGNGTGGQASSGSAGIAGGGAPAAAGAAAGGVSGGGLGGSVNGGSSGSAGSGAAGAGATWSELAIGKAVKASSEQPSNEAPHGNDNAPLTRWCAAVPALPQWWRVDLGAPRALHAYAIRFEHSDRLYTYQVESSLDDVMYTSRASIVSGTGAVQSGLFPASLSARYVRITVTSTVPLDAARQTWASFYELSVTGN